MMNENYCWYCWLLCQPHLHCIDLSEEGLCSSPTPLKYVWIGPPWQDKALICFLCSALIEMMSFYTCTGTRMHTNTNTPPVNAQAFFSPKRTWEPQSRNWTKKKALFFSVTLFHCWKSHYPTIVSVFLNNFMRGWKVRTHTVATDCKLAPGYNLHLNAKWG